MADINIQINSRVDIICNGKTYRTTIEDVTSEYIAIASPIRDRVYLPLHTGEVVEVVYYEKKETYGFKGRVIKRGFNGNVPLVILEYPKRIYEIQRREFVRVEVAYPVRYIKVTENNDSKLAGEKLDAGKGSKGMLLDLSGGGLRIKIFEDIKYGDIILADVQSEKETIRIKGEVVRLETEEKDNEICGIRFIEMDNRNREKIIGLIFEIMRKQRKTL